MTSVYEHICPQCQIAFPSRHPDSECCSKRCARMHEKTLEMRSLGI